MNQIPELSKRVDEYTFIPQASILCCVLVSCQLSHLILLILSEVGTITPDLHIR